MDATLLLNETDSNILIGAADENIPLMDELANQFGLPQIAKKMTTGASFFMLSDSKNSNSKAKLIDTFTTALNSVPSKEIVESFLSTNNLNISDIDLVLFNSNGTIGINSLQGDFKTTLISPYEQYCGYYFSNSAFGMHLATQILSNNNSSFIKTETPINRILLYNTFNDKNIGLTLLQSLEA